MGKTKFNNKEKDKSGNHKGVSVIIPVYNEETEIGSILQHLLHTFSHISFYPNYEIIAVDDGSTDKSADIAESFEGVKVIRQPCNIGYGAAIKEGVRSAKYEWIMTIDSDGQHRLDYLHSFFEAREKGYELIIGSRQKGSYAALIRRPGKAIMGIIANYLANTKIPDVNSGMRLFKKSVFFEFMPLYPNGFSISTTMTLAFLGDGYSVKFIPVKAYKRAGRKSNVRIIRDGFNAIITIMRTISLFNPLRVFVPPAIICGVIGVGMTIFNISYYGRVPNTGVVMSLGSLLIFLFGILVDQFSLLRRQHSMKNNRIGSEEKR